MNLMQKKIFIFDLDDTLAQSKTAMDQEMSEILSELLRHKQVAVISGAAFHQFEKQFLVSLNCPADLISNLSLFPTCATSCYQYKDMKWEQIYQQNLTPEQKEKIMHAFTLALEEYGHDPTEIWGEMLEDRGPQITFSALGQSAPLEPKKAWDPKGEKRLVIKSHLEKYIPEFEIRVGGATSIDVTRKGIDKAYGIRQIESLFGIKQSEMIFYGDALFPGGNDYPVKEMGVESIAVEGPEDTKRFLKEALQSFQ